MASGNTKAIVAGSILAQLRCPLCVTMSRWAFGFRHIYPGSLDLVVRRLCVGSLRQRFNGSWEGVMHDPATGLRRTPLPRTPVNKGKKGGGFYTSALSFDSLRSPVKNYPPSRYGARNSSVVS